MVDPRNTSILPTYRLVCCQVGCISALESGPSAWPNPAVTTDPNFSASYLANEKCSRLTNFPWFWQFFWAWVFVRDGRIGVPILFYFCPMYASFVDVSTALLPLPTALPWDISSFPFYYYYERSSFTPEGVAYGTQVDGLEWSRDKHNFS